MVPLDFYKHGTSAIPNMNNNTKFSNNGNGLKLTTNKSMNKHNKTSEFRIKNNKRK